MKFDCFEQGFFIPHNLYFIGTMNDIDRSVESFDFALRRRFQWIEIKANDIMENSLSSMDEEKLIGKEKIKSLTEKIQNMNNVLVEQGKKYGLTEAYHIGPAYFKELVKSAKDGEPTTTLEEVFERRIEPIIKEYMRGRDEDAINALINECKNALLKGEKENTESSAEGDSK
jgi:5-methylcytosine-specific restriction endonuclease McrBC GTP-binding regulatory subunit McrB